MQLANSPTNDTESRGTALKTGEDGKARPNSRGPARPLLCENQSEVRSERRLALTKMRKHSPLADLRSDASRSPPARRKSVRMRMLRSAECFHWGSFVW